MLFKRYEDSLNNLLETVAHEGVANVSKGCLALWYGQERFTAGIRSDLKTRFSDMSSYIPWLKDESLVFVELGAGSVIMILKKSRILADDC